jgi:hypothetical protein
MRKWLVIFMLFLLPIRGLVGDAMAYSMLPNTVDSVVSQAATVVGNANLGHQKSVDAAPKLPCHTDVSATSDADAAQNQCTTCQACHLGALADSLHPSVLLQAVVAAPAQHADQWHSAEPRLLAKTPVL